MFQNCKNELEAKNIFRRLAMRLHPDYGGDNELMILLKEYYDSSLEIIKHLDEEVKKEREQKKCKYHKVYDDVFFLDDKLRLIDDIIAYGHNHPTFRLDFTLSIKSFLNENGYITSLQYNKLLSIYNAFKMYNKSK
jgi:hypothetical protein